jgi:putative transposase
LPCKVVRNWLTQVEAKTLFIEPSSPWENGYCDSFNGKLCDELLNGEIFYNLREAQIVIEQWPKHYNTIRPNSALNYKPPAPQTFAPSANHLDEIMPMQQSPSRWYKKTVRSRDCFLKRIGNIELSNLRTLIK